jgi:hypothetical protein
MHAMGIRCSEQSTMSWNATRPDRPGEENSSSESWQRALFAALTETNRVRALPLIRHAQLILDRRLAEISSAQSSCSDEAFDLRASRTYLGILLQCIGSEQGELLWD